MRAWVYGRVSELMGRTGDTFHAPEMYEKDGEAYAASRGWEIVGRSLDLDRTGTNFNREHYIAAYEAAGRGEYDVLIVPNISRFGRNVFESLRHIAQLREWGVKVVSCTEPFDETPYGEYMLIQRLNDAQLYSRQVGENWRKVHRHLLERGQHHGRAPFGYRRESVTDPDTGKVLRHRGPLLVDDEAAGVVRDVFAAYADGLPGAEVIRLLRSRSRLRTNRGNLRKLLGNVAYIGQVQYGGQVRPGAHERIVDDATWDRVQARLRVDAGRAPRDVAPSHALSGAVRCGECGGSVERNFDGRSKVWRLRCSNRTYYRTCDGVGAPRYDDVERVVLSRLIAWAGHVAARPPRPRAVDNPEKLRRQLTGLAEKRKRLALAYADGMDAEVYKTADGELAATYDALLDKLDRLAVATPPAEGAIKVAALAGVWGDLTGAERAQALRAFDTRVVLHRGPRVDVSFYGVAVPERDTGPRA